VLVGRKCTISVVIASAAVILERILDILIIVVFAGLLMTIIPLPSLVREAVQTAALAVLGAFVILVLLSRSRAVLTRREAAASARLPQRLTSLCFGILDKFVQGLRVMTSLDQLLKVVGLSALSWSIAGLGILCFVKAFHLPVPWQAAALVLVVTNLGGAIPSSPGAIGVYEFCAILALSVWVSDRSLAASFALVTHVAVLILTVGLGIAATYREGTRLSALVAASQPMPPTVSQTEKAVAATNERD